MFLFFWTNGRVFSPSLKRNDGRDTLNYRLKKMVHLQMISYSNGFLVSLS